MGHREIAKRSEHGLGRYLDPISPNQDRRDRHGHRIWISEAWHWVLRHHEDDTTPMPEWASKPALSRVTVSSPLLARPFTAPDRGRPWRERIKPFNFLLVATIDPFGYPPGADPTRFRLIAPYTNDPDQWLSLGWRNVYDPDGPRYRITTDRDEPSDPCVVLVKTYADVLLDYRNHPEHKFLSPDAKVSNRVTAGVLMRRPVHQAGPIHHIGKEANRLDDVQAGLVGQSSDVTTEYPTESTAWLRASVLPPLKRYSGRQLAKLLNIDRRTVDRIRQGRTPQARHVQAVIALAVTEARNSLQKSGEPLPPWTSNEAVLAAWSDQNAAR